MIIVKNLVLGIGIFIVFMLMLGYGIEAFYPSPKYEDYCSQGRFQGFYPEKPVPASPVDCSYSQQLRDAEQACYNDRGQPIYQYDEDGCTISVRDCDYCQREFEEANKKYSKNVFVIALIVGIVTLFVGFGILSVEPVGSSLMASGVGAIFYGSVRNWQNLSDVWRFLLLLVALVLLVWIALRLNKKKKGFFGFGK
jgi:hypothetical protein